jgi:hypothetical protein
MPFLTETSQPRMRHLPVWLLILAVGILPLGVFAWSCYRPITLEVGVHGVGLGGGQAASDLLMQRYANAALASFPGTPLSGLVPRTREWGVKLPSVFGRKYYHVWWY